MHAVHCNFESVHLQVSKKGPVPIDVLRANLATLTTTFSKSVNLTREQYTVS